MTLDVRGGLKNTAINHSDYVVLEEMLSNAIDSYLIRRASDRDAPPFSVEVAIELRTADLLGDLLDVEICCKDNGAGFGDDQVKAFVTKDSTYKDYLDIQGIGKCKGAGRIQFFHHYNRLSIDSVFATETGNRHRSLTVDASTREISESSFTESEAKSWKIGTEVRVWDRKRGPEKDAHIESEQLRARFSSGAVTAHLYTYFLQRFITLKGIVGDFSVNVTSKLGDTFEEGSIRASDLPVSTDSRAIQLVCSHGHQHGDPISLKVTRYSLPASTFVGFQHEIALCANAAAVQSVTKHFLKNPSSRKTPIGNNFELILIEGEILEESVNQQRDGFNLPTHCSDTQELSDSYSFDDIIESLEDYVFSVVTPADFDRGALVRSTEEKFGITQAMLEGANIKIHFGDTEDNLARRVLKKFQEDIVADTSNLLQMKQSLLSLDPRDKDFRAQVNELAWMYTSTIKKVDMANLSQLVVRRSAMIELLRHAVHKLLDCQQADGKRNENERIIHNVFFPMGKDSNETSEHDIWLLSEEYQYFDYIASDKPLASLTLPTGDRLFVPDVDDDLLQAFRQNNKENLAKRPDIALFSEEGAAIIVEFKSPDVELQDHSNDLIEYARLLAAKSEGKISRFYGYLIGGKINHNRVSGEWKPFSSDKGYFCTSPLVDRKTKLPYGELYSEMLLYKDFIDRADVRLGVYRERLNVSF